MNRFLLLLLIAGIVFLVILFAARPDLLDNVWMWVVGLIGGIVKAFQSLIEYFKNAFKGKDKEETDYEKDGTSENDGVEIETVQFNGTSIDLLRYSDDGDTTVGLLTINGSFYCYTLEDTYNEPKEPGETRIPAGIYTIQFRKEDTELTTEYRNRYPEWFNYHIQLKDVQGFDAVYIHNGGDHTDTEGCILVSDSLNVSNDKTILSNSRNTFKRLYAFLQEKLDKNIPVRLRIKDEKWIKDLKS